MLDDEPVFDDFVEKAIHFNSIDSTNSYAKNMAEMPGSGIFVIAADSQTEGRGQRENSFYSPIGGLYASIICPIIDISKHFDLNRAISLAIRDAITALCPGAAVSIKWPNDILWSDKKICGILLESAVRSARHIVVGFGLNVNTDEGQLPAELRDSATSLKIQTNKTFDIAFLLRDICRRFQTYRTGDQPLIHSIYVNRLYRRGGAIGISGKKGIFETVLEDGRLCLITGESAEYVPSGSIEFID